MLSHICSIDRRQFYSVKLLLLLRGSRTDGLPDQPAGRQVGRQTKIVMSATTKDNDDNGNSDMIMTTVQRR